MLSNPQVQTILASVVSFGKEPPSETKAIQLDDGDKLSVVISDPGEAGDERPTVLMVHGLCGSHRSPYLIRLAQRLYRLGIRSVRVNLRGCGSGRGWARRAYHAGRSDDLHAVVDQVGVYYKGAPIILVGFSLGGHLGLKLLGELGEEAVGKIAKVISVCPPADLNLCATRLAMPFNRLYDRNFVRQLKWEVIQRQKLFSDLPRFDFPEELSVFEFDDLYTAPSNGFADASDYYARCSSVDLVPRIRIPCKILFSRDDPFVGCDVFDSVELPDHVEVVTTEKGGHMGFLGRPLRRPGGYRWMDSLVCEWIVKEGQSGP